LASVTVLPANWPAAPARPGVEYYFLRPYRANANRLNPASSL
jgi:hypothetical protein